jgi:hypothetical protein
MSTNMEIQHLEHQQFMEERGRVLFGRTHEVERIRTYIHQHVDPGELRV